MPYTNIELVRKHLTESERTTGVVEDQPVKFDAGSVVRLPHAGIVEDSERVKGKEQLAPTQETITLANDAVALNRENLIPESAVVALDSSLATIYTENVDYTVDYAAGQIRRIDSGAITSGSQITVWYYAYTAYEKGVDYAISHQNGELTRIDGGKIEVGQSLWVDYEIESGLFSDDVITNAILEASAQIDARIDNAEDAVSILTIAETYLAVAILTQIRALETLQSTVLSAVNRGNISTRLIEVSARYRAEYEDMIRPYLMPASGLCGPVKSTR
jgi:hypothetical protein